MRGSVLQGKVNEQSSPGVLESDAHDASGTVVGLVRVFLGKLLAAIKNFASSLRKQGASEKTINAVESIAQAVAKKIRENAADARRLDPYGVAYDARGAADTTAEEDAGTENPAGGGGVGASQQGGAIQSGAGAAVAGNQGGGSAVQKGAGSGSVPGHDADASATRKELAAVRAELDAKKEAEEAARGRRNAAIAHVANRLADFTEVLAEVPADKRAEAEALLKRAIMGAVTYVVGVNHTRFPAAYMAAAPGLVQTSHLPDQQFAKNPAYGGSNTRKYESGEAEQNKVRGIALPGALDAGSVANTAKSASEGTPQIAFRSVADVPGHIREDRQAVRHGRRDGRGTHAVQRHPQRRRQAGRIRYFQDHRVRLQERCQRHQWHARRKGSMVRESSAARADRQLRRTQPRAETPRREVWNPDRSSRRSRQDSQKANHSQREQHRLPARYCNKCADGTAHEAYVWITDIMELENPITAEDRKRIADLKAAIADTGTPAAKRAELRDELDSVLAAHAGFECLRDEDKRSYIASLARGGK